MPTIYHWTQPLQVDQVRYDELIGRYGWYAQATSPTTLDKAANKRNSDIGFRVPENWGQYWYPALRNAMQGGKAQMAWVGSSTMKGYYCSDLQVTSAFAIVRDALQAIGGNGGDGVNWMTNTDLYVKNSGLQYVYDQYKGKGNLWTENNNGNTNNISTPTYDLGPTAGYLNIAGGAYVDIAFKGQQLAIWFFNSHSSSPFTYSIDGGAPVTVTPGPGMGGDIVMISLVVATDLAKGVSHTVRITGGTTGVRFCGIDAENVSGLVCNNYAIPGMVSHRISNRDGYESGTYMGGHRFRNRYGVAATEKSPDLLVIAVPPNNAIKVRETFTNATTTNASTTVAHAQARRYHIGRSITGSANIPAGATVTAVQEGVSFTISAAATGNASDVTLTVEDLTPVKNFTQDWEQYMAGVLDNIYGGGTVVEGKTDVLVVDNIMKISSDTVRPTWREIESRGESLATVYGSAYVNVGATLGNSWSRFYNLGYMGNTTQNNVGKAGADDIHMSDKGQEYMAKQILKVLLP
jgi:hypothetical protein